MKLLLNVLKRIHKPAVYSSQPRCRSSSARSGLLPLRDEALIVGSNPELVQRLGPQVEAIHGYRETERVMWGERCEEVLSRVRSGAFPEGSPLLGPVHILDLDKTGYIKPHIDSVKFCGSTIAGLSLLSDSIMRLVKEDDAEEWLDLLLPRFSLYILRDQARYNFTHQILKDEESVFNGQRVPRLRRISVICRNLPG
ncbi:alpha-ketoglutarate-dependent dioxygenase alkB homolog 7, mitochondrial isoform X2 [Gymnodraco acuticeps]|uniref:Alpha-ketoglutarate-dependent dioxygenase alkB homolog 7, mitochondrial isoform X2 n=1 Tax=Gymnodraco acuticeps TaxID=8218 RepID=A0A6P8UHV8_GYMAC|nr:alpha-ketoglutarate-dependent dioxygenase alkB homolog 7, mitochondrial isoform X2 [Pseudochaenichthys georgianus]XP_034071410.1 alpha-ketoglutarate-dependent dioxygenase alkB homolog 7, mitochondrial isoform X2 [Gymnodraco acuticeps]